MSEIVITIRLEVPDGAKVSLSNGAPAAVTPSLPPADSEPPFPGFENGHPVVTQAAVVPICPQHGPLHFVPAGQSKKPPYRQFKAFWGCSDRDCNVRADA